VVDATVEIVVQINGKVKGRVTVPTNSDEATVMREALASDTIKAALGGAAAKRSIFVANKLLNLVL